MKKFVSIFVLCFSLAAMAADDDRYNAVGNQIQCSCGCQQILIKCNHIGCQSSDTMIRQLRVSLAKYSNDEDVLNWFRQNYGTTVVLAPATHGFELSIWLFPPLLMVAGVLLVIILTLKWHEPAAPVNAEPVNPKLEEFTARARRETEL